MCGIVGYVGCPVKLEKLISNLEKLEYRGYDSSGVFYLSEGNCVIEKEAGKIFNLKERLSLDKDISLGIAHTRWATHGGANRINAHPHKIGNVTIVHNGIIENYRELKEKLEGVGYSFVSETDTEIAAGYFDYLMKKYSDMKEVMLNFQKDVVGSYAILLVSSTDLKTIWAVKKDSPLVVSKIEGGIYLASDVHAISEDVENYYVLEDYEFCKIDEDIVFYNGKGEVIEKYLFEYDEKLGRDTLGDYEHYMLKEIEEQPDVISYLTSYYTEDNFARLLECVPDFTKYSRIFIVACGTAMHSGLVFKNLIEKNLHIETSVFLASEFRYQPLFLEHTTLVLLISQSGETADTLKALQIAKEYGSDVFSLVNVFSSSIARGSDYVLYTRCGSEVAVASTKAYVSQVYLLSLILASMKNLPLDLDLPVKMKRMLENEKILELAKDVAKQEHVFYIGRGIDYSLCQEASLKLKEISYIHSESYASGELKHGTISLIEKGTIVIGVVTDEELLEKEISNLMEVKARGARVVLVIRKSLNGSFPFDDVIEIDDTYDVYQPILAILPLQLLAYYAAKEKGCSIDQPRNLAKSVTVE